MKRARSLGGRVPQTSLVLIPFPPGAADVRADGALKLLTVPSRWEYSPPPRVWKAGLQKFMGNVRSTPPPTPIKREHFLYRLQGGGGPIKLLNVYPGGGCKCWTSWVTRALLAKLNPGVDACGFMRSKGRGGRSKVARAVDWSLTALLSWS